MNRQSDFDGEFRLFETRESGKENAVLSGYRPLHKLYENHLSSGNHEYPEKGQVAPGEVARVRVWLITPAVYPGCLWLGRELDVMEGPARVVGKLTITRIFNEILSGSKSAYSPDWTQPKSAWRYWSINALTA
jgi:hypothetical protein